MDIFYADTFTIPLPAGHRFPMSKYRKLRDSVADLGDEDFNFRVAPQVSRSELEAVHCPQYVQAVLGGGLTSQQEREIGLPWSPQLVTRSLHSCGATVAAVDSALHSGVAVSLAGGTHHADRARGAGFCVFNDTLLAAVKAVAEARLKNVLIIDCDVHQGEGNAEIASNFEQVYVFSIHSARNFPHRKSVSNFDIGVPDGCAAPEYNAALSSGLEHVYRACSPELAIYLAGADIYAGDRLGRLAVSASGIAERDRAVFELSETHGVPVAVVMGGGYAEPIEDSVAIHCRTVQLAGDSWRRRHQRP